MFFMFLASSRGFLYLERLLRYVLVTSIVFEFIVCYNQDPKVSQG